MQRIDGQWIYSATDLNNFLECRRLPELELLVALGKRTKPNVEDAQADLVRQKGQQHEQAYLETLRAEHDGDIEEIAYPEYSISAYRDAATATIAAMREGRRIIYQATFFDGTFLGHADFLRRVETPSPLLGVDWSYAAVDTKLALSTKPYFIIQLCNYSEHLARVQGTMPKCGSIVFGDGKKHDFAIHDYYAYYQHVKARFLDFMGQSCHPEVSKHGEPVEPQTPQTYPLKCEHCSFCVWDEECTQKRKDDDHLSLVARMRRDQHMKLEAGAIAKVEHLAAARDSACPPPLNFNTFTKLRKQAQLQVESRRTGLPVVELLPHDPRIGFGLLPQRSDGDVYFDMEGDPMYEPRRALEYLFGCWLPIGDDVQRTLRAEIIDSPRGRFIAFWGRDPGEEKQAFEDFIDFIVQRRRRDPDMHVYHYANYEKAALTRLSQQYNTRGEELDELLRSEVLVDLYTVVRQSMLVGEESYSIKKLERFYGMQRATDVKKGDESIVMFEQWRITQDSATLNDIRDYNKDDCESTYLLHKWLLEQRLQAIAKFGDIPFRPLKAPDEPCHAEPVDACRKCQDRLKEERERQRTSDLERELLRTVVAPKGDDEYYRMREDMRTRYLLGHLLSYHRREMLPAAWEFYKRCRDIDTLQNEDKEALGGLVYADEFPKYKQSERAKKFVHTYRFPPQQHKMDRGEVYDPAHPQKAAGEIVELDDEQRIVKVLLNTSYDDDGARAISALIPGWPPPSKALRAALATIAEAYLEGSLRKNHPATYDLLASHDPRLCRAGLPACHPEVSKDGEPVEPLVLQPKEVNAAPVSELVRALDRSYLFIQGPPGSGKSTVGSEVICDLLHAGKRVGVISNSHKAIHHLLGKVEKCMAARGDTFRGLYKHSDGNRNSEYVSPLERPMIESVDDNHAFDSGEYDLAGGTAWLFARKELVGMFDYLFIDEAGQVSLANTLAVSLCAKNIVLLGDPSQLAQVSQGTHATHADDSILEHLLKRDTTVADTRGVFLDHSYRMHPDICAFISDAMYDGRLKPGEKTRLHRVASPGLSGAGLRYIPIVHDGNGSSSEQEAERIIEEIRLLREGTVIDDDDIERPLTDRDIIVVTPYNAQRRLLERTLKAAGLAVAVGTVDKFQGQEAAVVFYSMATSSGEDVPRDVGFLFEANRFNVAISRARAMSILVCSPRLLDVQCRTAEQMALVNLLCAYVGRRPSPVENA